MFVHIHNQSGCPNILTLKGILLMKIKLNGDFRVNCVSINQDILEVRTDSFLKKHLKSVFRLLIIFFLSSLSHKFEHAHGL